MYIILLRERRESNAISILYIDTLIFRELDDIQLDFPLDKFIKI